MKKAIVLTCDDTYAPYACIAARRILWHAREPLKIMIVCLDLQDETRAMASRFCPGVALVDAASFAGYRPEAGSVLCKPHYLRLFLDEMLHDLDHVVYLDCDVSLLTDVSPLLSLKHVCAPIIAAHDPFVELEIDNRASLKMSSDSPYFNSGVMVLDMKGIREEGIFAAARAFAAANPDVCSMSDQDALNAVLDGRWQTLDWRWNAMSYRGELATKPPFMRHFAGNKPWTKDKHGVEPRFVSEWRSDFKQSPWQTAFMSSR